MKPIGWVGALAIVSVLAPTASADPPVPVGSGAEGIVRGDWREEQWRYGCALVSRDDCQRGLELACVKADDAYACRWLGEMAYGRSQWPQAIKYLRRGCSLGDRCACGEARQAPSHNTLTGSTACS